MFFAACYMQIFISSATALIADAASDELPLMMLLSQQQVVRLCAFATTPIIQYVMISWYGTDTWSIEQLHFVMTLPVFLLWPAILMLKATLTGDQMLLSAQDHVNLDDGTTVDVPSGTTALLGENSNGGATTNPGGDRARTIVVVQNADDTDEAKKESDQGPAGSAELVDPGDSTLSPASL